MSAIASSPHISTGPPFERLYAVEPDGVEQIRPSHGTRPKSWLPIDHSSSTMRPSSPLETTASFTATWRSGLRLDLERRELDRLELAGEHACDARSRAHRAESR